MTKQVPNIWLIFAYLGVLAIIYLSLVPGDLRPHTGMNSRGFEHFAAYALEGMAFGLGLSSLRRCITTGILLSGLAGVLEILQHFSPGRHSELIGFIASSAGVWAGLLLAGAVSFGYGSTRTPDHT